jgi:DNA-binding phage protein
MSEHESGKKGVKEAAKGYAVSGGDRAVENPKALADQAFIGRMRVCADLAGSVNALARKAELSQSGIRRYFTGGDPTRKVLSAMAAAAGVHLLWLATGEGPMLRERAGAPDGQDADPGLSLEILRLTVETVEEALLEAGRDLRPAQKAEMAAAVYELFRGGEGKIEKAAVLRLVKSAS